MFYEGKQIGAYKLVKILGRGGFGEVWLAEKQAKFVTTKVAVKLPLAEQFDVESIRDEAVLWEQASGHPNVLPIIDADEYDGQAVIVSEYAPDGTLDDLLRKRGALPYKKAVELVVGILSGLEYLHNKNIVHRDIKPANILLQGDTPRLADFGLSRAVRGNSMSVNVNGTPYYMAPEAFSRKRNRQTDIWSVGVVLYKMLAGKLPFQAESPVDLMSEILVRKPDELPAHVPARLNEIVGKALAKLPDSRYVSASGMREDLTNFLSLVSYENFRAEKTPASNDSPIARRVSDLSDYSSLDSAGFEDSIITNDDISRVTAAPVKVRAERMAKKGLSKNIFRRRKLPTIIFASLFVIVAGVISFPLFFKQPLVPFRQGDKFGFSKINKKITIGARYDLAHPFAGKFALVAVGSRDADGVFRGKYGFIDAVGREIIPLEYDAAADFSQSLAKIGKIDSNGSLRVGFIDEQGAVIIPLKYDEALNFTDDNLAAVRTNNKWGFINRQGEQIIPARFDQLNSFSEKLAAFRLGDKWGFIDVTGRQILPPVYDFAGDFSDAVAPVKKDGKAFFIDASGKEAISFKYDNAQKFSEKIAQASIGGKSGFIDKHGGEAIPLAYADEPAVFSEGLAAVKLNNLYGYISRGGSPVIDFKYAEASAFQNGLARVKNRDGKEFYIRYDGTEFLEP